MLNIVLIGMPGAGKSTLGKALALKLKRQFLDTDTLIEQHYKKSLQQLLDEYGYLTMRKLESDIICQYCFGSSKIIATGGSVVYSKKAMQHLAAGGICIYLEAKFNTVQQRVTNLDRRGFNCAPGQTLFDIFEERRPLYERYTIHSVSVDTGTPNTLVDTLSKLIDG